jgi:hypothetical protein
MTCKIEPFWHVLSPFQPPQDLNTTFGLALGEETAGNMTGCYLSRQLHSAVSLQYGSASVIGTVFVEHYYRQ